MRDTARRLRGTRAYDFDCVYRGKRLNYIGALAVKGILSVKRIPKSLDGELFKEYIKEELLPKLWEGAVLVVDLLLMSKLI